MSKLSRGKYIIYIDASFGDGTPNWFKIGKNLTSLTVDLSPDVSVERNILDETSAIDNGYTPQSNVDPFYANPDDSIYEKIKDIAMNRKTGDECTTKILEVLIDNDKTAYSAWTENILVKPSSVGGETTGLSFPFDIYFEGGRQEGTVSYSDGDYKTGNPTFVAKDAV